jgi:hypothetical protein
MTFANAAAVFGDAGARNKKSASQQKERIDNRFVVFFVCVPLFVFEAVVVIVVRSTK